MNHLIALSTALALLLAPSFASAKGGSVVVAPRASISAPAARSTTAPVISRPSTPSYTPTPSPAPAPTVVKKVEHNTTIINQHVSSAPVVSSAPSSGGGFFSTLFGSFFGSAAGNLAADALKGDDKPQQQHPQPAAAHVVTPAQAPAPQPPQAQ